MRGTSPSLSSRFFIFKPKGQKGQKGHYPLPSQQFGNVLPVFEVKYNPLIGIDGHPVNTVPQVYEIQDSHYLESIGYRQHMKNIGVFTDEETKAVETLVELFRNGKTIGSLIKMKPIKYECVERVIYRLEHDVVASIFEVPFTNEGCELLKKLLAQAKVLSAKYDVMITNPPYIGISSMEATVKDYATKNYPNSKTDMFAMFMETGFVKPNGFTAMINMHSWMFLSSFEKLRKSLLASKEIIAMIHLGAHAFEAIGGEVVQTTTFILRGTKLSGSGVYYRLVDSMEKESDFLAANSNCEG